MRTVVLLTFGFVATLGMDAAGSLCYVENDCSTGGNDSVANNRSGLQDPLAILESEALSTTKLVKATASLARCQYCDQKTRPCVR